MHRHQAREDRECTSTGERAMDSAAANRSWSAALSGDGRCALPGRIEVMAFLFLLLCVRRYTPVLGAPRDTP